MARRKPVTRNWRFYCAMAVLLAAMLAGVWYWWTMRSWAPPEAEFPDQGVALLQGQGDDLRFATVSAMGGKFAYFEIGPIGAPRDAGLSGAMAAARTAGIKTGAVLEFDPCAPADPQSARFVTLVPRDVDALPPAIALGLTADNCPQRVSDAALESELMTLINQVEMHSGRPVILKLSRGFEERYGVASSIARDLWVAGNRFAPHYAGRPWLLWSANGARHIEGVAQPVEWVVVQP